MSDLQPALYHYLHTVLTVGLPIYAGLVLLTIVASAIYRRQA